MLHALQCSSNVSQRASLSLLLQHTALGDQLDNFRLKPAVSGPCCVSTNNTDTRTGLKWLEPFGIRRDGGKLGTPLCGQSA